MINNIIRVLVIGLSVAAIPYLILLVDGITREDAGKNKTTKYVLVALFVMMIIGAVLSVIISLSTINPEYSLIHIHPSDLSRFRSLLIAGSNFLVARYFYHIFTKGGDK